MYTPATDDVEGDSDTKTRAAGSSYRNVADSRSISMLGLGMVIGAAIGAGIALVSAPRSGEETRDKIRDRVRHIRGQDDAWDKLKRELKRATSLSRHSEIEKRKERDLKMMEKERAEKDARTVETT